MAAPGPQLRVSLTTSTKDLSDNRGNWQTINARRLSSPLLKRGSD